MERTVPIAGILHDGQTVPPSFKPMLDAGFQGVILRCIKRADDAGTAWTIDRKFAAFAKRAQADGMPWSSSGWPLPGIDPEGATQGSGGETDKSVVHQANLLHLNTVHLAGTHPTLGYSADIEKESTGMKELPLAGNYRAYMDQLRRHDNGRYPLPYVQDNFANERFLNAGIDFSDYPYWRVADYRKVADWGAPPADPTKWDEWLAGLKPTVKEPRPGEPDSLDTLPPAACWQFNCEIDGRPYGLGGIICVNIMNESAYNHWLTGKAPDAELVTELRQQNAELTTANDQLQRKIQGVITANDAFHAAQAEAVSASVDRERVLENL